MFCGPFLLPLPPSPHRHSLSRSPRPSPSPAPRSPSPPCRSGCRNRVPPCTRPESATAAGTRRGASIILAVPNRQVRLPRSARLAEDRQRARQADLELGGGIAARVGDDLDIDVVRNILPGGERGAAPLRVVGPPEDRKSCRERVCQ